MFTSIAAAATASAIVAIVTTLVVADDVCTPGTKAGCNLHLKGTFLVHAVDERRVLVAIDTHDDVSMGDGRVDHLFLITARGAPKKRPEGTMGWLRQGALSIESHAINIELRSEGEGVRLLPLKNVNWAHYWGYGDAGPRIADLTRASQAEECDHVAGSCWRVNGMSITFPS